MKIKLLFPFTLALVLAGCNKSGKLNEPSTFVPPAGPAELKVKWMPKEKVVQEFDLKQQSEMNLPGQSETTKQNLVVGEKYSLVIVNADSAGGHQIEMQFLGAHLDVERAGRAVMNYDSSKREENKKNPIAGIFKKIIGSKVEYFLDASNNIDHLEGVNELHDRIASGNANAAAQLQSLYDESFFRQLMIGNQFLPLKSVQPGDSWPVEIKMPGVAGDMTLDYTMTFVGWEMHGKRECAHLEFQGTIKAAAAKPNDRGITVSIQNGDDSGVGWFDPELGIGIDSQVNEDLTLVITYPKNGRAGGETATMTNTLQQTVNVKLDSVN